MSSSKLKHEKKDKKKQIKKQESDSSSDESVSSNSTSSTSSDSDLDTQNKSTLLPTKNTTTKDLFDDADEKEGQNKLAINEEYAARLEHNRRRQEIQKLQEKYGTNAQYVSDDEDSSEYSSEDSDAELVTPAVDAAILRVLDRLKSGDKTLYEKKDGDVFEEEEKKLAALAPKSSRRSKSNQQEIKLKDYQLKNLLNEANNNDNDGQDDDNKSRQLTNAEESKALKEETIAAFHGAVSDNYSDSDNDNEESLLKPRQKTEDELQREEREYKEFIQKVVGKEGLDRALQLYEDQTDQSTSKKSKKKKSGMSEEEKFLSDFILNRGWMEKKSEAVPTYDKIVRDKESEQEEFIPTGVNAIVPSQTKLDTKFDDEDEEFEEKAEAFEEAYNFRFLEEGGDQIQTHARNIEGTARREDNTRSEKRKERKERKAKEKSEKAQELEHLRNLQRQEALDKIKKLRDMLGNDDVKIDNVDVEGDFDPNTYDQQMSKAFDDTYYDAEDPGLEFDEDGKPVWNDDIDVDDLISDNDGPVNMDADFLPGGDAYDPSVGDKDKSKRKKKAEKKKNKKNKDDQDSDNDDDVDKLIKDAKESGVKQEDLEKYADEYYKDHEDIIGDIPVRFNYTRVKPDYFDLSPVEILMATDAELNSYVGPKKLAPYRSDADDPRVVGKNKKLKQLRKVLESRKWGVEDDSTAWKHSKKRSKDDTKDDSSSSPQKKKKRLGKNERKKKAAATTSTPDDE